MEPIFEKLITTTFAVGTETTGTLQQQLHARLRTAILCGDLPAATRLPSSRAFAVQQAVSRNTVLAAYEQLVAEGYLETRRGAGTFVSRDLPDSFIQSNAAQLPPQPSSPMRPPQKQASHPPTGLPAVDAFPLDLWARLSSTAWRHASKDILLYRDPMGYKPLRRAIATYLTAARSVRAHADQILIVSGLQQGLTLIADSLMNARDTIILENPGYGGLLRTARAAAPQVAFTPVDQLGACVPETTQKNNLLVVSPSHQYPLGITMPTARRLALIQWAKATNSLILEDDYDSEFRYRGRPLNSLQGIAGGDHVIYGGSFSKVTFLALRLGYLVLPEHLIEPVLKRREATDSFPSIMAQLALAKFISDGHFARHIRRLRKIHAARQQIYIQYFNRHLSRYFTLEASPAGLDLVARPTLELQQSGTGGDNIWAKAAHNVGLSALPLSATYRSQAAQQGLLLGFANFTANEVRTATHKLAQIMLSESGF
jgi:GntR family transcriptional regulator / MocR family aminotransferase